jgi:hypothetical protein
MPKTKKTLVLHERRELWRVRWTTISETFCHSCQAETTWLPTDQAVALPGLDVVSTLINREIHFKNVTGELLVCRVSLELFLNSKKGESK